MKTIRSIFFFVRCLFNCNADNLAFLVSSLYGYSGDNIKSGTKFESCDIWATRGSKLSVVFSVKR